MIIQGRHLIIKAGGVAIAAAKSCDINVDCDEIETATTDGGSWRTALLGRKSWSVSTNQLMTSIVRQFQMIGTKVSLSIEVADGIGALAFDGFLNNPTVQQSSLSGRPVKFYWDTTRNQFIGESALSTPLNRKLYINWSDDPGFLSPADYSTYMYGGCVYFWHADALTVEKLTGYANVKTWRATGTTGNLAQGSFQFNGNGALTPASLPTT